MELVAPAGPVYQAGTLSGNPIAMSAGVATLDELDRPGTWESLEETTRKTAEAFEEEARAAGVPVQVAHAGAMFGFFFSDVPVTDWESAAACDRENGMSLMQKPEGASDEHWDEQRPQWIRKVKLKNKQTGKVTSLPMMCQHCENPPCCDVCPTGASFRRADGIVMVDRHTCIGCRYCMMACPYKARSFIHQAVENHTVRSPRGKGCVESCNLCVTRIDSGMRTTACQDACSKEGHDAILFGDLKDSESAISKAIKAHTSRQIRGDLELNTGVRYTNL